MQTLLYLDYIIEAKQQAVPQEPPPPSPEQIQAQITAANIENIQKYVLFNKVLSLKYQLESSDIQKIDYKNYSESLYFLNVIISFFDSFSLNDLNTSINYILDTIIKTTNLGHPNMELLTDPVELAKSINSGEVKPNQINQAVKAGQIDPKVVQQAGKILNAKTKS
jgi:hypothetical protein